MPKSQTTTTAAARNVIVFATLCSFGSLTIAMAQQSGAAGPLYVSESLNAKDVPQQFRLIATKSSEGKKCAIVTYSNPLDPPDPLPPDKRLEPLDTVLRALAGIAHMETHHWFCYRLKTTEPAPAYSAALSEALKSANAQQNAPFLVELFYDGHLAAYDSPIVLRDDSVAKVFRLALQSKLTAEQRIEIGRTLEERPGYKTLSDEDEAVAWYTPEANKGNLTAQTRLGMMQIRIRRGDGLSWLNRASENGGMEAQYELGMLYKNGAPGVPINKEEALKQFRLAAAHAFPDAEAQRALKETEDEIRNGWYQCDSTEDTLKSDHTCVQPPCSFGPTEYCGHTYSATLHNQ